MEQKINQQEPNNESDEHAKRSMLVAEFGEERVTEAYHAADSTPGVPDGGEDPERILEMGIDIWRSWHDAGRAEYDLIYCGWCERAGSLEYSWWEYSGDSDIGLVCPTCEHDPDLKGFLNDAEEDI
jgi:hypothetical protein